MAELVIISSYPASPRRITVLVNFQAILLIFLGETFSNRDIFFTEDAAKNFFSDLQNFSTRNSPSVFFLIWSHDQSTKLTFLARSRLAPKFSKVVAKAKKLGAIKKKR